MLLIVGTVRLPAENLAKARTHMADMVSSTLAEDGCEEYSYAEDVLDAGLIHIKEVWRDQQALDLHFQAPHMGVWRSVWPELGIGERNLRIYEVGQPRHL